MFTDTIQFRKHVRRTISSLSMPVTVPAAMVFSGTFIYPIHGMIYFIRDPMLWAYLFTVLIPELALTMAIYSSFYTFLYPPQAALAVFFNGPSGLVTACLALLHQSAVAAQLISNMFLLPLPLRSLFDAVMSKEGHDELVLRSRLKRPTALSPIDNSKKFAKSVVKGSIAPMWLFRCLLRIALHFVPIAGPLVIVALDGPSHGRKAHNRYFELKRFDEKEINFYVRSRRGQYWGFGLVAGALESIPLIGFVFTFTNTVGAAKWAAEVEKRLVLKSQVPLEASKNRNR